MGWKIWSVQELLSPTDRYEGRYFSSRKAVHDMELVEHDTYSCFRVLKDFCFS